jgi:hypothetical protein
VDENVTNDNQNVQSAAPTEQKPTEQCPTCDIDMLLIATSTAHIACNALDGNEKAECMAWADGLDPEKFKAAKDIVKETLGKAGLQGVKRGADAYNLVVRAGIVDYVAELLDRDTPVPPDLMNAYKQALNEQGV